VNVTYDCCSESEYENIWVRVMRNVHVNVTNDDYVVLKANMKKSEWE
jgi:hypothetical protein